VSFERQCQFSEVSSLSCDVSGSSMYRVLTIRGGGGAGRVTMFGCSGSHCKTSVAFVLVYPSWKYICHLN
jgi:hypothetical protein